MKTVQVFMSTFNGGKNIERQVKTILDQQGVKVELIIRDDGSSKKTKDILNKIEENSDNVRVIFGENIGYKKSFLNLLSYYDAGKDYFAFSDQDDIWNSKKLYTAVKRLERVSDSVKLYVSGLSLYDEKLNFIKRKDVTNSINNIYSFFTRNRYAGCTFVFNGKLAELVSHYSNLTLSDSAMPDHDFVLASFAYAYGTVVLDSKSLIKHIRYQTSVTSGKGLKKRFKVEFDNIFKRDNPRYHMAQILLDSNNNERIPKPNVIQFLNDILHYKDDIIHKILLLKYLRCGIIVCNVETSFQVLIGNF